MKTMLFYQIIAKIENANSCDTILKVLEKIGDSLSAVESEKIKQIATDKMELIIEQMHN